MKIVVKLKSLGFNGIIHDLTVVALERQGLPTLIISSAYLPYDEANPPSRAVRTLVDWCNTRGHDLIIGCDANAHHTLWGSSDINDRGECLLQYLLSTNLSVCNRGNIPTFFNRIREQVIDITLVGNTDSVRILDWRVSLECSFSDHHRIVFTIQLTLDREKPFRNPRKTDWVKFCNLSDTIPHPAMDRLNGTRDLDDSVDFLSRSLREAYYASCRERQGPRKFRQPWWNPRLMQLRKECRKLFNKAKRDQDLLSWDDYRQSFNTFKRETRRAKRASWERFCGELENTTEASRLRKVLSKDPGTPGFLMKPDGNFTESSIETLELLMETHFPGCRDDENEVSASEHLAASQIHISELVRSIVSVEKISWAVSSFKPYKSPGPDGIFPALLQKSISTIMPWLIMIFSQQQEEQDDETEEKQNQ
ncbi:uncharacterized protein LOC135958358 [Calliphora vicina]|uniref:uncharacterized protein LOC135958358 n=1 Tax=Calliphora vicina TaxID=7373 RepID=UPI00325C1F43